jgi:hypothetical protein
MKKDDREHLPFSTHALLPLPLLLPLPPPPLPSSLLSSSFHFLCSMSFLTFSVAISAFAWQVLSVYLLASNTILGEARWRLYVTYFL